MAILLLSDGRGGEADEHPATIGDNQVAIAQDIDYYRNTLGGRRNGSVMAVSGLPTEVNDLILYQPNLAASGFLWALDSLGVWSFYDAAYVQTPVFPDPPDTFDPVRPAVGATLHGKLFLANPTDVAGSGLNRLHVWDGVTLRRTGIIAPSGDISGADYGVGGVAGERWYRQRYIAMSGTTIVRRSEPSPNVAFTPTGSGQAVRLSRLDLVNEGETHWEVEASPDDANYYRIATIPVATTIYDDTIDLPQNIATASGAVLSADIGDYALQGSYRWLAADRDRLLGAANYTDDAADSDVEWTPVGNDDTGVGNDERVPVDTGNRLSLDGQESGSITGMAAFDGRIIVFKAHRTYSLTQTGIRTAAYLPQIISTTYGALKESVVEGTDAAGRAALYFVDPILGPMRLSPDVGFEVLAPHLRDKFQNEINFDAAYRVVNAVYHPGRSQVWWHFSGLREFARGCCPPADVLPDWPSFRWCFDVRSGGSSFHSLPRLARTTTFWQNKPIVSAEGGAIVTCDYDSAPDDYGVPFRAYTRSRAWELGQLADRFEVRSAMIEGRAIGLSFTRRFGCVTPSGVNLLATLIRDYGVERLSVAFDLNQVANEQYVMRQLDNLHMAEATAIQIEIGDASGVSQAPWVLFRASMRTDKQGSNIS